jgi:nitrite reductase/ring-hydroxylating ferredoxin subunit
MPSIGPITDYANEGIYEIKLENQNYLLIKHQGQYFCVEDKCGHFGVPLANGKVKDGKIYCSVHNISFDLLNGQVRDSMGENCEPIAVIELIEKDGILYCNNP